MKTFDPENERAKRAYERYLKEAAGRAEATVRAAMSAIAAFERFTGFADFKRFKAAKAIAYREHLMAARDPVTDRPTLATIHTALYALRSFFRWLPTLEGYRKRLAAGDAEYFNLSARDQKIATTRREAAPPTVEQVKAIIFAMRHDTDVEKRNRALLAFMLLTGARVKALTTLKLMHVNADINGIIQDARLVETKGGRSYPTFFFPVGDDVREIFVDYVRHLRRELGFDDNDPLFPSTKQGANRLKSFEVTGLKRAHWATTDPVREIFKKACAAAGSPYFNPHSLRSTLALLGQEICRAPSEFKAWSQNLGHLDTLTTYSNYGTIRPREQAAIIARLKAGIEVPAAVDPDLANTLRRAADALEGRSGS